MTPSTQWALQDFVRFAGENGCSLYFDRLFRDGLQACPISLQERYGGLRRWKGLTQFKHSLRRLLKAPTRTAVLPASRTTQLMRLGAHCLFRKAKRVLYTDLVWPSYGRILEHTRKIYRGQTVQVRLRRQLLRETMSAGDVIERVVRAYLDHGCDGFFLPEISHHGVRLPVGEISSILKRIESPRFALIDGAQALGHAPVSLADGLCDFFFAGSQKWLGAYLPLGIAVCPKPESACWIKDECRAFGRLTLWEDPLGAFVQQVEDNCNERFSETVNLSPLFCCQAAIVDRNRKLDAEYCRRMQNAEFLSQALPYTGWVSLRPTKELGSGILLVQAVRAPLRRRPPDEVRAILLSEGVSVSTYAGGVIRLSMPDVPFTSSQIRTICSVFLSCHRKAYSRELAVAV
jgi:hypothetical protein